MQRNQDEEVGKARLESPKKDERRRKVPNKPKEDKKLNNADDMEASKDRK